MHGKDARLGDMRLGGLQPIEPRHRLLDLVAGDALALGRGLGRLGRERALGIGEPLLLREHFALELGDLRRAKLIDGFLDLPFAVVLRLIEPALDGAWNANARIADARAEDLDELVDVHLRAGLAEVFHVRGLDLGGVAHDRILY